MIVLWLRWGLVSAAEVKISSESNTDGISAQLTFKQESPEAPLLIQGIVTGLPQGLHGFHVHENADLSQQCMAAGGHYNPTSVSQKESNLESSSSTFHFFRVPMEAWRPKSVTRATLATLRLTRTARPMLILCSLQAQLCMVNKVC